MIQVIETNLNIDKDNIIRDHQSRIVEVEDWDTYCKAFEEYSGEAVYFKSKTMRYMMIFIYLVWSCIHQALLRRNLHIELFYNIWLIQVTISNKNENQIENK